MDGKVQVDGKYWKERGVDPALFEKASLVLQQERLERFLSVVSLLAASGAGTLAIDGRCASGKTTLAEDLHTLLDASVVHMDDFFLPPELRTPERYAQCGGNVHYERFLSEVVPYLGRRSFSYRHFNCSLLAYDGMVEVPLRKLTVVEGSYALHPKFGTYVDKSIFLSVEPEEQLGRLAKRCPQRLEAFRTKWIPLEEAYFRSSRTRERADLVL